ncbi:MAG TPA: hypothetical protein DCZ93_05215 [Elusimicrobia bacterium]|nr:MAG: hypothetical protein A2X35_07345 [Elusimicrobia bacterium GWA2_61_42]OGR75027.1 MAG: hypothetical protein A2X38_01495 [Elusimicrobia bacterium GWC2_61_25]HBB66692.1 hypothetical protein [Elusimicrobiota bacterium]
MVSKIDSYAFGHIVINGSSYTSDVIVFSDRVQDGWWREDGHRLEIADLREALSAKPEVLVVGCGCYGVMEVPAATADYVRARGIDLVTLNTGEAAELFNSLSGKKKVVAALHLTC